MLSDQLEESDLTFRCPSFIGTHVSVAPDLAKRINVGSDHSKNLTSVFNGSKNEKLSFKTKYIFVKVLSDLFCLLNFCCAIFSLWFVTSRNDESLSFRSHNRLLI